MLRPSLVLLLVVAAASCCAPNSPRRPIPRQTAEPSTEGSQTERPSQVSEPPPTEELSTPRPRTEEPPTEEPTTERPRTEEPASLVSESQSCAPPDEISREALNTARPETAADELTLLNITDAFVSCRDAASVLYFTNNNNQIERARGLECTNGKWHALRARNELVATPKVRCLRAPKKCAAPDVILWEHLTAAKPETARDVDAPPHITGDYVSCKDATSDFYTTTTNGQITAVIGLECKEGNWFVRGVDDQMIEAPKVRCMRKPQECTALGHNITQKELDASLWTPYHITNVFSRPNITKYRVSCGGDTPLILFKAKGNRIQIATEIVCMDGTWFVTLTFGNATDTFEPTDVTCLGTRCTPLGIITQEQVDAKIKGPALNILSLPNITNTHVICSADTQLIMFKAEDEQILPATEMVCMDGSWFVTRESDNVTVMFDTTDVTCFGTASNCAPPERMSRINLGMALPVTIPDVDAALDINDASVSCSDATSNFYVGNNKGSIAPASGLECKDGNWHLTGEDNRIIDTPTISCLRKPKECAPLGIITQEQVDAKIKGPDRNVLSPPSYPDYRASCDGDTPLIMFKTKDDRILIASEIVCIDGTWFVTRENEKLSFNTTDVICLGRARKCAPPDQMSRLYLGLALPATKDDVDAPTDISDHSVSCIDATSNFYVGNNNGSIAPASGLKCKDGNWHLTGEDNRIIDTPTIRCLRKPRECADLGEITQQEIDYHRPAGDHLNILSRPNITNSRVVCGDVTHQIIFKAKDEQLLPANNMVCVNGTWSVSGLQDHYKFHTTPVTCLVRTKKCDDLEAMKVERLPLQAPSCPLPILIGNVAACSDDTPYLFFSAINGTVRRGASHLECNDGQWSVIGLDDTPMFASTTVCCVK